MTNAAANSLAITYPEYDSITNTSSTIDILFSLTVESDPFADGLFLTNQANSQEGTTNAGDQALNDIVQIKIGEPELYIGKTAVSTDHVPDTDIVFEPDWGGVVEANLIVDQFELPGVVGDPFIAPIGSDDLSSNPSDEDFAFNYLDSTLIGVDGGDLVKYTIIIENRGHGADGAFDIAISDILPLGMTFPDGDLANLNLQIYNGAGDSFGFEVVSFGADSEYGTADDVVSAGDATNADSIFSNLHPNTAIRLVDPSGVDVPGACQVHDLVSGANVIIITYDLEVPLGETPESVFTNEASLLGYGAEEGGPNFLAAPIKDTANIEINWEPGFDKVLISTELFPPANPNNGATEVVIGEILTYEIKVKFFELVTPSAQIVDTLDAGLAFVDLLSVTASNPDTDGAALADDGLYSSVMTFDGATGVCTNCVEGANPAIGVEGSTLTFNFGDMTNTNIDNLVDETIIIQYRAVATNVLTSDAGDTLGNSANLTWTSTEYPTGITDNDNDVTVLEPQVTTTKAADPTSTDAGNTVTYTVTLTNGNGATDTDAYDVAWSDTLPVGMTYVAGTLALGICPNAPDTLLDTAAPTFTATWDDANAFPKNSSCEIIFDATIDYTVNPGETLTNTADTLWTSMPGDVTDVSTYNTEDDERTGDDVGGTVPQNDYTSTDDADVTITNPAVEKYLVDTSEAHTGFVSGIENVAIGEIVRYRIVASIPEGTSPNFQVSDWLPAGLIFLNDDTAEISFVSNNGISSTGINIVPAIPAGCNATGSAADAATPANLLCTLADENIASTMTTTTNTDSFGSGDDVFFRLGDLINNDSDADAEYVVIELNALVHNSATNQNDAGDERPNRGRVYIDGLVNGNDSPEVDVRIVEPHLVIDKNIVPPAPIDAGDPMEYTISITNDADTFFGSDDAAAAFDLNLSDALDTYLDLRNGADVTVTMPAGPGSCGNVAQSYTDNSSTVTETVDIDITCLNPGETVTVNIIAYVVNNVPAGVTIANTATITGTSLPGAGTPDGVPGNDTGSSTPGASGTNTGERNDDDGIGGITDDYIATDTVNHTLDMPTPIKSIVSTSEAHTADTTADTSGDPRPLVIGEIMRYRLAIQLPEGTNIDFIVEDIIPAGLTFVDGTLELEYQADNNVTNVDGTADTDLTGANSTAISLPVAYFTLVGQTLTINLASPINNDINDGNDEYAILEFNVLVNNGATNQNTTVHDNDFTVEVNSNTPVSSNTVYSEVLEPVLNIAKSADDSTWIFGQTVTYTLNITHTVTSTAEAFDIVVTDAVPTELSYGAVDLTLAPGWTASYADPTLTLSCLTSNGCSLALDASVSISFTATVNTPPTLPPPATAEYLDGTEVATNTANMVWTSLPGTGTTGNATGSDTPGASGDVDGERNGNATGENDYYATDSQDGGLDYYALGNRVWFDTNNNALIDNSEVGVNGVEVQLYADTGNATGTPTGVFVNTGLTSTTVNGGYYLFDYLEAGEYIVIIPDTEFSATRPLEGYYSSLTSMDGVGVIGETAAPDPDNDIDSDDNGTQDDSTGGFAAGTIASLPVTLGPTGNTEPTTDNDFANGSSEDSEQPDGRSNLSVDFGFYQVEIGNLVYRDDDANGTYLLANDTLLDNVLVQLYETNGTEIITGADGILGTADDALGPDGVVGGDVDGTGGVWTGTGTFGTGEYLFSGLPAGNYKVRVTTPDDLVSTIDTFDAPDNANPDVGLDDNDNGIGIGAATAVNVTSAELTMSGGELIGAGTVVYYTNADGTTTDLSVDFGFTRAYAIGNRVWYDTDNNSLIDFGTEVGVDGITVQLFLADGSGNPTGTSLATDTTTGGGYYLFDYLTADDYVVVIPASNFGASAVLEGYWSSATQMLNTGVLDETRATGATDNDADSDDNGLLQLGDVISVAIAVGPTGNTEPINEADVDITEVGADNQGDQPDVRANMTVDFGFYKTEIGNLVFNDNADKNGVFDGSDAGIDGVTMELFTLGANGTVDNGAGDDVKIAVGADGIYGTADDAGADFTTSGGGIYSFSGLPEGEYYIRAGGQANYTSTIDTNPDNTPADVADPDTNVDNNDNGVGTGDGAVSSAPLTMDAAESAANIAVDNNFGTTTDLTVDFGFLNAYALGNRVWFDTDNSSDIDAGEVGVYNVTVELFKNDGTGSYLFQSDTTTNADGYYLFDYLDAGEYVVVIPAVEFASGGTLEGYYSSGTAMNTTTGAIEEATAPDADSVATDSDDNGNSSLPSKVTFAYVTLGTGASEPTGETDLDSGYDGEQPDAQANMTVDFGFYKTEIGNLVWLDQVADGEYIPADDSLLNGVTVELYNGITNALIDSTVTANITTDGEYIFTGLPEGDYIVKAIAPTGTVSTRDDVDSADNADPDTNTDDNDNGIGTSSGTVASATLTMDAAESATNIAVTNLTGTTTDLTVDFGFSYAYALGNRVWFDTDNDSSIDFVSEVGVSNVTVELYAADGTGNPTGTALASDLTDANGYYLFDYLFPGDYVVVIPADEFVAGSPLGGTLEGYWSSATSIAADGTISETAITGLTDDDQDSDDNGTLQASGDVISVAITLGTAVDSEPSGETDLGPDGDGFQPPARSNLTVDFGFYKTEIGNLVFGDVDKNGNYESATDTLYSGVTVQLYAYGTDGTDGVEIPVGVDGVLGTADDGAGVTLTNVSGVYRFSGLPAGDYVVKVIAPNGTVSTIDSFDAADIANPNTNSDDNDNGIGELDGIVIANFLTMNPGDDVTKPNRTVTYSTGTTLDYTVDFGFTTVFALGNRVWFDTNNNALIDNGEVGVNGVTVELYADDGFGNPTGPMLDSDLTVGDGTNDGYYLFDYLETGDYIVVIPAAELGVGGTLEGYWSSSTNMLANGTPDETRITGSTDDDADSDDNGLLLSGDVISVPITLGPTAIEQTLEGDLNAGSQGSQPDSQANMTVDFGFYTMTLGNLVWDDADNSGTVTGVEAGINNVTVQLYAQNGTTLLDSVPTAGGGLYTFTGLPAGDYIIRIPAAEFEGTEELRDYVSSTGAANAYEPAPDADADITDDDDNGSQTGGPTGLGGYIQTDVVTLTPIGEASYDNATGTTSEPRVDFGVFNSPQADLAITKDDGQDFYLQGGTLTYEIVVSNNGPADVTGATVSDTFPAQIASTTWTCTPAGGATCTAASTGDISDTVNMPIGSNLTYTVTATIDAAATGVLTNTATVTAPAGVTETDLTNNTDDDVDNPSILTIIKDDGLDVVAPGSVITYAIDIYNGGLVDLSDLTVTDTLPADVSYQSATPAPSSIVGNVLEWDHAALGIGGDLLVGAHTYITLTVQVSDTPVGTSMTNNITVSDTDTATTASDDDTDAIAVDNTKSLVGTSEGDSAGQSVFIGEILTYEINITVPDGVTMTALQAFDVLETGLTFDECVSVSFGALTTDRAGGFAGACPLGGDSSLADPVVTNTGHNVTFNFGNVSNASGSEQILTIQYWVDVLDVAANVDGVGDLNNEVTWSWDAGISTLTDTAAPVEIVEPDMSIAKDAAPKTALLGKTITFTVDIAHTAASTADAYDVVVTDTLPAGLEYVNGSIAFSGFSPTTVTYDAPSTTLTIVWDHFQLLATSTFTFDAIFVGPSPVINEASAAWTSIPLDPGVQSEYNANSTERWYDPADPTGVDNYGVSSEVRVRVPLLPETGFAPERTTQLPNQPVESVYAQFDSYSLEIPRINVKMPIVGVPSGNQGWDLTWLADQAGWLEGTAYPTWAGNTALTAHTYLADGTPGPFVNLKKLYWGDKIIIRADGQVYIYQVRETRTVWPHDLSILRHETFDWITLITCQDYNENTDSYSYRTAVRAVLIEVQDE